MPSLLNKLYHTARPPLSLTTSLPLTMRLPALLCAYTILRFPPPSTPQPLELGCPPNTPQTKSRSLHRNSNPHPGVYKHIQDDRLIQQYPAVRGVHSERPPKRAPRQCTARSAQHNQNYEVHVESADSMRCDKGGASRAFGLDADEGAAGIIC
jgi:hypothetical protein